MARLAYSGVPEIVSLLALLLSPLIRPLSNGSLYSRNRKDCHDVSDVDKRTMRGAYHSFRSLAIEYLHERSQGSNTAIVYLYCNYKDTETHSDLALLASIARQLTEQAKSIPKVTKAFCERQAQRRSDPGDDEWLDLIKSLCLVFSDSFLLVDALVRGILTLAGIIRSARALFWQDRLHIAG